MKNGAYLIAILLLVTETWFPVKQKSYHQTSFPRHQHDKMAAANLLIWSKSSRIFEKPKPVETWLIWFRTFWSGISKPEMRNRYRGRGGRGGGGGGGGGGPQFDEIRMNMSTLQRIDPFICRIIESASQVSQGIFKIPWGEHQLLTLSRPYYGVPCSTKTSWI